MTEALQRACAIGSDGGEGRIGEVLDGVHLNPAAVFPIAQGMPSAAANTQVPDGEGYAAGDLPGFDVGADARASQGPGGEAGV